MAVDSDEATVDRPLQPDRHLVVVAIDFGIIIIIVKAPTERRN